MPAVTLVLALAAGLESAPVDAQIVSMSGSFAEKALLVIDGKPRTLAAGSSVMGVKLITVNGSTAVVEVGGRRMTLAIGGAQVDLGGAASQGGGSQVVLAAGSGGHFFAEGSINGRSTRFLVDTGATYVSMGVNQAERLGIDYRKGRPGIGDTANGQIAVYKVTLASVRVGDVQVYDVEALIGQPPMDVVLLGNSFLTRFRMKRDNDTMVLFKRY